MFWNKSIESVSDEVTEIVRGTIETYRAGLEPIPNAAFTDRYVVGYVNALLINVAQSILHRKLVNRETWTLLEHAWSILSPSTAKDSYRISREEFDSPTNDYSRGIVAGDAFAQVTENGVTPGSRPEVVEALRMAEEMTELRPIPDGAVAGVLLTRDFHRYIADGFTTVPVVDERLAEEGDRLERTLSTLQSAADRFADLEEQVNAIVRHIKRQQASQGQEPSEPKIIFVNWDWRPAIIIGSKAWFVQRGSSRWEPADYDDVHHTGYLMSSLEFSETFGDLPQLTVSMV